ncbi:MAG: CocE/NonD family hydrolase [Gemmatimonadota bacterium]
MIGRPLLLALLISARLGAQGSPYPEPKYKVRVEPSYFAAMRDGVKLSADFYFPEGVTGKLPTVLIRTPYNKKNYRNEKSVARWWASQGYAVVVQDVRGKYESDGVFTTSANDRNDGYDTMTWVAGQPWTTGKVGTYGCSYLGEDQIQLASMRHPNHTAAIPQAAGGIMTYFGAWNGGANELVSLVGWFRTAGVKRHPKLSPDLPRDEYLAFAPVFSFGLTVPDIPVRILSAMLPIADILDKAGSAPNDWKDFVSHPPENPFWKKFGYVEPSDSFDVPALHVNSWYDPAVGYTSDLFNQMQRNAKSAPARDNQFLVISPTPHCASEALAAEHSVIGERDLGDTRFDWFGLYLKWFDYWLKGIDNGVLETPKVQMYVMGGNRWRSEREFPLARTVLTPYYFHSDGRANSRFGSGTVSVAKPSAEPPDRYVYDPVNPVPSRAGPICCTGASNEPAGAVDQRDIEARQDVLVYTSPPLDRPLEVTGLLKAVLYVSSSAKDTDFTVKLLDVLPDGTAYNLQEGIKRARYRDGYKTPVLMEPDGVYRVEVNLQATSNVFLAGHRLRLEVSSSNYPRFDRNLNGGGKNWEETVPVTASNVIHHSAKYPSHIVLPVVP